MFVCTIYVDENKLYFFSANKSSLVLITHVAMDLLLYTHKTDGWSTQKWKLLSLKCYRFSNQSLNLTAFDTSTDEFAVKVTFFRLSHWAEWHIYVSVK